MSDFDSGNSVYCVLLDVNLYETKREKQFNVTLTMAFYHGVSIQQTFSNYRKNQYVL